MAMRLISQRPLSYYKSIRGQFKDHLSIEEIKQWVIFLLKQKSI